MGLLTPPNGKFNGSDVIELLTAVGGWTVASDESRANVDMIVWAGDRDLITIRKHFALLYPDGVDAYEVTDKGLEVIARILGDAAAIEVEGLRTFHREHNTAETWREAAKHVKLGAARRPLS